MRCPECQKDEKKSKVYPQGMFSTLMNCEPYYDEEGVYHYHDINRHTRSYVCSEGHRWSSVLNNICPGCDWKSDKEDTGE